MKMKKLFALAATSVSTALFAEPMSVGSTAPTELIVKTDAGAQFDIGKALQSGMVLVYFYPKADTPGCTKQACSIRDAFSELSNDGLRVYGVSMDSVEAQAAFKEKYSLPFTLIADTEGILVDAMGVPKRGRFPARQAFLFNEGELVWRDLKASTAKQAADVREAMAQL